MYSLVDGKEIRAIILYGSVARGDHAESSDIDIFIDVPKPDRSIQEKVNQTVKQFPKSLWFRKWKTLGIKNRISVLAGNLDEWEDLKRSIASNGIVLYGSYSPKIKGRPMALLSIGNIKPESNRVFINRKLFGYNRRGKRYKGLVETYGGDKVSNGCFLVPIEHSKKIIAFLRKRKATPKIREVSAI